MVIYLCEFDARDGGYVCTRRGCGIIAKTAGPLAGITSRCRNQTDHGRSVEAIGVSECEGPGTEFSRLTALLGLRPKAGCQCASLATEMNGLKVEGCIEHRLDLITRLQANFSEHYGYSSLLVAALRAKKLEALKILRKLRTLDAGTAIERLFDLAVEQSAAKLMA